MDRIFPLSRAEDPLYADEADAWELHLIHDPDGYGVGFTFRYGETTTLRAVLSDDDAEELGSALMMSAAIARVRNDLRGEWN